MFLQPIALNDTDYHNIKSDGWEATVELMRNQEHRMDMQVESITGETREEHRYRRLPYTLFARTAEYVVLDVISLLNLTLADWKPGYAVTVTVADSGKIVKVKHRVSWARGDSDRSVGVNIYEDVTGRHCNFNWFIHQGASIVERNYFQLPNNREPFDIESVLDTIRAKLDKPW